MARFTLFIEFEPIDSVYGDYVTDVGVGKVRRTRPKDVADGKRWLEVEFEIDPDELFSGPPQVAGRWGVSPPVACVSWPEEEETES